ncbi:MAG: hypothetical protein KF789_12180 [Bdellovibrionaceae bacterium]|nr:hypothetical protein [Pseudobdellovibrionaceae bacterium]
MADFNCRMDIPEAPGLNTAEMTVGREAFLSCAGPWPELGQEESLAFELPKEQNHVLKMLGAERLSGDTLKFKITSYQVGDWDLKNVIVTDGKTKVDVGALRFEVKSVLDPKEPRQEPYGLIGPLSISIPLSWWIVLGGFLLGLALVAALQVRKRLQRRRLVELLESHDSALSPISEFHRTLRMIRRDSPVFFGGEFEKADPIQVVADVEKAFRIFLLRRFHLPAFTWSDGALRKALKKENPHVTDRMALDVKKLLQEFASAKVAAQVEGRDAVQLHEGSRRLAEALEKAGGPQR